MDKHKLMNDYVNMRIENLKTNRTHMQRLPFLLLAQKVKDECRGAVKFLGHQSAIRLSDETRMNTYIEESFAQEGL